MERLSLKTKALYGLAGVGDSALYNIMGTFALFFLTTVAGVDPAIAGTITAIGSVWDTICGAIIGYVSDNTDTRFGKRKPFLVIASLPLMVFTSLFFFNVHAGEEVMIVYYGIMIMLFWTSFSFFFVPYLAWGAELTDNYDERTVLRGYVSFFNAVGTALGLVLPNILVEIMTDAGYSVETGWQTTGILCGVVSGGTILIAALGIKDKNARDKDAGGRIEKRPDGEKKTRGGIRAAAGVIAGMLKNYAQILKLRTVRYILGASICYLIGYTIFCSDRMYFFTYNMGLSGGIITVIMMLMTFISVAFIPLISFINRWIDKRTTYLLGMAVTVVGFVIFGLSGNTSFVGVCIISVIYCAGNSVYWQLVPAMIYDVCEVDRLMNSQDRAGMVISLQSLSEAMSGAVAMQLMGLILSLSGFDGSAAVQSGTALQWTGYSFTLIPALFMVLSMICIFRYPVTKAMYHKVLAALERRDRGKDVDMSGFRKLR